MTCNSEFLSGEEVVRDCQIKEIDLIDLILNLWKKFPEKNFQPEIYFPASVIQRGCKNISPDEVKVTYFSKEFIKSLGYEQKDSAVTSKDGEIQPYRDSRKPYYSEELAIAIEAWLAIYGPGGSLNPSQKHRKQIIIYLQKEHPEFFPQKCDLKRYWTYNKKGKPERKLPEKLHRIVTMINADPAGGAEKSCT